MSEKRRLSVTLTGPYIDALDHLVEKGLYIDHQDAIRDALRRLFQFHGIKSFTDKGKAMDETYGQLFDRLSKIANTVYHSNRSPFLTAMAYAWYGADQYDMAILRPAWEAIIKKYDLDKEAGGR